jgi:anaerobic C4-dicarboxylate transporter
MVPKSRKANMAIMVLGAFLAGLATTEFTCENHPAMLRDCVGRCLHDALICFALFLFRHSVFVQSQFGQVRHRVGSKYTTTVSRYDKAPTNCRGFFIISRPPALMEIIKGLIPAISCTGTCQ